MRQRHVMDLVGELFDEVRDVFAAEDWGGLRPSHFRVIAAVPPEGVSVTELAERVGMTKQGVGQFVTTLVASGHLAVGRDTTDRRIRLVRRTPDGSRTSAAVTGRILALEEGWAARVGERRYRTFRRVLEELAVGE